jgi:hypothetical protein
VLAIGKTPENNGEITTGTNISKLSAVKVTKLLELWSYNKKYYKLQTTACQPQPV